MQKRLTLDEVKSTLAAIRHHGKEAPVAPKMRKAKVKAKGSYKAQK